VISRGIPYAKLRLDIGKSTFFVANQANLEVVPAETLAALESQTRATMEDNKQLSMDVKSLTAGSNSEIGSLLASRL
jgi:hypothetical protein